MVLPRPSTNGLSEKQAEDAHYGLIKAELLVKAGGPVPVSAHRMLAFNPVHLLCSLCHLPVPDLGCVKLRVQDFLASELAAAMATFKK
jgi:hypothetical protein